MAKMTTRNKDILLNILERRNWRASFVDGRWVTPTTTRGPQSKALDGLIEGGYVIRDVTKHPPLKLTDAGMFYATEHQKTRSQK